MQMKKHIIIIFILFLFIKISFAAPVIELDGYSGYDFTGKNIVLIQKGDSPEYKDPGYNDSGWDMISLPSCWNKLYPEWSGVCWYRIHVRFPEKLPDFAPGISLGKIDDVDEVYLNGSLIGKTGEFPPERKSAYDIKRIYEMPVKFIRPGADNIIAVRVAGLFPGENGGYKGDFYIAPYREIQKKFFINEFIEIFFIIIYLAVGGYFGLVFTRGTSNKEHLFFSLFTLSVGVYLFFRTQMKYLISNEFLMMKRFEYFVLIIILLFMMEYITYYFKRKHNIANYFYYAIVSASIILITIKNDPYFWNQVLFYVIQPSWIIPLAFCFYVTIKELKSDADAKYMLATFIIIGVLFINDVLIERRIYDFMSLSNYGFVVVILGTAVIMRNRYSRLYNEVEIFRARKSRKPVITDETKKKFDQAVAFIEENYMHDISRENFAESIGINHDYLGKLFIQHKGKKMSDYINEMRIKKAGEMLLSAEKNVTEIAFEVGFDSLSTFYRVFQKIMGEKPTDYREKNKNVQ